MDNDPFDCFNILMANVLWFRKQLLKRYFTRSLTFCMRKYEQPHKVDNSVKTIELYLLTGS